ncbi:hypothetical protein LAWI1_G003078 [Lachnellula willkommii]|uniref:BTB domain-containing protein n=1 Tax=Lachnellula willkommii TaxID=215461 RepID=A0A559M9Q8_9HELO|nr:hypothetical protein LAWI1_G003078 [Lachnellula willkommii]
MASPNPIVFTAPGLGPDMSIEVFKQIFHVNSMVLKIHSEYFRNYLDSPDKAPAGSVAGAFKYEWVTQVDEDGKGWSLTAKEKVSNKSNGQPFTGKPEEQIEAFKSILCALHIRPITIKTPAQLCQVTELADFYRILPAVSTALNGTLFDNPEFLSTVPSNCVILLEASYKLRNKILFKECFIHVMGPWSKPRFHGLKEQKLKDLGTQKHMQLCMQIMQTQLGLVVMISTGPMVNWGEHSGRQLSAAISDIACDYAVTNDNGKGLIVPLYYRLLCRIPPGTVLLPKVENLLKPMLKSQLVLDKSGKQAGEGIYMDSFLCFEITDEELPWDVKQTTW